MTKKLRAAKHGDKAQQVADWAAAHFATVATAVRACLENYVSCKPNHNLVLAMLADKITYC